jgi:hypothetical protein
VVAVLVASLAFAACDSSPYAASVNSETIKQAAFNDELHSLASTPGYVQAVDSEGASQGYTVAGTSPGTYNNLWVALVLTDMISATVVRQQLVATGGLPGPSQTDAARSVNQARYGPVWGEFSSAYREVLVERDANHNMIEQTTVPVDTIRQAYQQNQQYFFSQVCARRIAVSVLKPDGTVDQAASLSQAKEVQAQYNATHQVTNGAATQGGSVTCYDAAQLYNQPAGFVSTVLGLAPGMAAAPQPADYGYDVVAVDSRQTIPFDSDVQRALSVAIAAAQGQPDPALTGLLTKARIKVNPLYGTWSAGSASAAPGVKPPSGPSPAAVAG